MIWYNAVTNSRPLTQEYPRYVVFWETSPRSLVGWPRAVLPAAALGASVAGTAGGTHRLPVGRWWGLPAAEEGQGRSALECHGLLNWKWFSVGIDVHRSIYIKIWMNRQLQMKKKPMDCPAFFPWNQQVITKTFQGSQRHRHSKGEDHRDPSAVAVASSGRIAHPHLEHWWLRWSRGRP